jgi:serine/threonine protein kinase
LLEINCAILSGWFENVDSIFIAMEYFQHGDLFRVIQDVGSCMEQGAKVITMQLLEGLSIMHDMGFTHRDLKPQVGHFTNSHRTNNGLKGKV